jgi:hypothetical protein
VKKSIFLVVLLGLFCVSTVFADPGDTLWTRTYGGEEHDCAYSVQQTSDGGYILAGETSSFGVNVWDVYLIKTDANGDSVWARTYGGVELDDGYSVQQTSDGGYIVFGRTISFGAGENDYYLVKTDADGDTLWTRTYGGTSNEWGHSVQQTTDGGYILAGNSMSYGGGGYDARVYVVKTDANGDTVWTRAYGGTGWEEAYSVQQTTDGGYVVTGYTMSFGAGGYDIWLLKLDANGDTLWTRTYGGENWDCGYSGQQTADGGYIVAGYTESYGAGQSDVYVLKTDADGDTLWTRTYGGELRDYAESIQETADGGYIVAGYTEQYEWGPFDLYVVKTDANGDVVWTRTHGGTDSDGASCIRQTTDGGYIAAGWGNSSMSTPSDVWLVKLAGEAPQPDVSIEIVPDDPPVTVPQGGTFGYTGTVTNNTEDPQTTDIWVMAAGPLEGVHGPFKEFYDLPLNPGQSRTAHFNQRVRNLAPLGFYNYIAYCGDYPSVVVDSSYFEIEVVSGPTAGSGGWALIGSFLEGHVADLPSEFALSGNYPNPFNAGTVISYQIPFDAHVKVEVYNISGQKLATLLDDQEQAGYRSVVWDASDVSSGIYFYKLTAGDFSEIKTMTLLR